MRCPPWIASEDHPLPLLNLSARFSGFGQGESTIKPRPKELSITRLLIRNTHS